MRSRSRRARVSRSDAPSGIPGPRGTSATRATMTVSTPSGSKPRPSVVARVRAARRGRGSSTRTPVARGVHAHLAHDQLVESGAGETIEVAVVDEPAPGRAEVAKQRSVLLDLDPTRKARGHPAAELAGRTHPRACWRSVPPRGRGGVETERSKRAGSMTTSVIAGAVREEYSC